MEPITFITGNVDKLRELQRYLSVPVAYRKLDLDELQSLDLEKVVAHKAREAFAAIGTPVLIEDVSASFHALGRLPGPLIKWFLEELGNDGICRLLDGYDDRSITCEVLYGWYDGERLQTFDASVEGSVPVRPRGEGFGWNPIFIPEGFDKTWAEMTPAERDKSSMRRVALAKLEAALKQ